MDPNSYDETRQDRRRAGLARCWPPWTTPTSPWRWPAALLSTREPAGEHWSSSSPWCQSRIRAGSGRAGSCSAASTTTRTPLRSLGGSGPTLDALAVAYQLEIRGYLAHGGPRRQARRIAATVLRVARQSGAEVIAVGQRRDQAPLGESVSARIAKGAPAHVLVSFAQPEPRRPAGRVRRRIGIVPAADGDLAGVPGAGQPVGDPSDVILTQQGRRLLAERAHRLRTHVLPELRAALGDRERDGCGADYERTVEELRRLSWLVGHAADAEDLPDDPEVVELGETVAVEMAGGGPERFLIVHPVEALLDDTRISAHSPLARALAGRRIGDEVEVHAPEGTYRCRILAADRSPSRLRRVT